MSQLTLSLLGSFQACRDEQPIRGFRSQKVRGLLTYLAVEGERPHTRAALAAFLWPDAPGSTAFNYLRSALANLRQLLGDRAPGAAGQPQFLLITRETLQLNPAAAIWLDTTAFAALDGERPGQQALESALALYRGPFLDGFRCDDSPAFAEWLLITREHFSHMALAVLQQLAALAIEQHRYAAAEEYCRRWLALEPWDETAHRQLMATLALSGNRGAALAHYQSCRSLLVQELGVEPAAETAALYARILSGQAAPEAGAAVGPAGVSLLAGQGQETPAPFVAREAELAQLDRLLALTLEGAGRVAFVEGDAGSGKTSLLHTFARRAAQRQPSIVIAEGHCSDCAGCGDPYLPFREIIRLLAGKQGAAPKACSAIEPWQWRQSSVAGQPALPAAGSAAPMQSDLFEQVTLFLQEMAQQQPLLLLLDDLQWADRGTISLLFHLSRQLPGSRILLVGAYRPEDVAQDQDRQRSPLMLVAHEVQRSSGDLPINLNRVDGRALIDALLDSELNRLGETFRATLYRHTEGQALFTVEILRAMKERGDLVQDAGGAWIERAPPDWQCLPPRIEAVVAERIERLPRRLRSLLEAASVQGEVFSLEALALQARLPLAQLAWWFGELLSRQHGLVRAESNADASATPGAQPLACYRFTYSLYQTYLYERLDPVRRASLHREVAEALDRLHATAADAAAVRLAWHREQERSSPVPSTDQPSTH